MWVTVTVSGGWQNAVPAKNSNNASMVAFMWIPFHSFDNCRKVTLTANEKQYLNDGIYFSRLWVYRIYISMEEHLTEEELAQYVDSLVLDKQGRVPAGLLEHVADCYDCKVEIMDVRELIQAIGSVEFVD